MKKFKVIKGRTIYYAVEVEVGDNQDHWDAAEKADNIDGGLWEEDGLSDWEDNYVVDLDTGEVWMF